MLTWSIGHVKITSIVESETPTSPRFLYKDVDKQGVLERAGARIRHATGISHPTSWPII